MLPRSQYVVAVRRGTRTRYFYGVRLKDAIAAGGRWLRGGRVLTYVRLVRAGRPQRAELRGHALVYG